MRAVILVAVLALASAACDDLGSAVNGPSSSAGRVEALIRDSALSQPPPASGTLSGNVFASIWNGTRWIDLGSPNGISVPLQTLGTASTTVHGEQSVPAGSYSRARLVFQGVTVRITRGSIIGGTTLTSDTTLTLGGSDARAELTATVDTFSGETDATTKRVVLFELRSEIWLTQAALQSGRVEDAALQSAIVASTGTVLR